jgi:outer membrane protein assembly factor BamD (BamD/ComL family)
MAKEGTTRMTLRLVLYALVCVFLLSCSGDKAKELLETAEFEERQMNLPHAKQLYEDVIRLYPTSKESEKAQARLAALKQTP